MAWQASIRPYLNQAYLLGLMMMAVGLTLSPFLMSLSQFWLVIVWLADALIPPFSGTEAVTLSKEGGGIKSKLSRFWHNTPAVLMAAFYLLHVVGLLYTADFQYALKDLRVKLPILILPFILSGMEPLDRKRFNLVMLVYVASVFVATLFSFSAYIKHDYEDVREISRFISHIRFCLNIVLCIAIIGYYLYKMRVPGRVVVSVFRPKTALNQCFMWLTLFWFAYQIFIFESLTGYVALAAVVAFSALYAFLHWQKGRGWRIAMAAAIVLVSTSMAVLIVQKAKPLLKVEAIDFATLDPQTAQGNPYWHDTIYNPVEDGKFVGLYYCQKELQEAWAQRSQVPFDGTTANGENLEATLARYLTSKDLRKDAEGVMALTDDDIRNVEEGVANYNNWVHPGLRSRLSATLFEYNLYRRFNNPNGGSLSQRIEFLRAAFHIIKRHWLFGVGTGDVPRAFSKAYDEIQSPLNDESRFRAHNQYLSVMIAFGVVGLALFVAVLACPFLAARKSRTYLFLAFLCIMALSMFPEDTLETQAGASLFAFFYAFLLFARK